MFFKHDALNFFLNCYERLRTCKKSQLFDSANLLYCQELSAILPGKKQSYTALVQMG